MQDPGEARCVLCRCCRLCEASRLVALDYHHPRLLTTAEKVKLQDQLRDTETAHRDAIIELEKTKETMEKIEDERAEMVASVGVQIERALASMAVDIDARRQPHLSSRSRSLRGQFAKPHAQQKN
jgi:hypothetical protein